ncbi:HAMP domain-containing sensor histidine kinase [Conexibacter sp. DBS9H8]|uniref:HAMP domain-containing sensor histidine kinase n=1 Tax=Conexibacter sp. DBS9H8 TaxID=2937801 RepID=UPI00200BCDD5|nr:HAMP domain-containing sensor histidine kinase [Conexibacter sp. DBS9H8]
MSAQKAEPGDHAHAGRRRLPRWGAFGLRGQIIGAVLITTVVTLVVAAIVLLPQLNHSLRVASSVSLKKDIIAARSGLRRIGRIDYGAIATLGERQLRNTPEHLQARAAATALEQELTSLKQRLGTNDVYLIGYIDASGHGRPISLTSVPSTDLSEDGVASDSFADVDAAFFQRHVTYRPYMSFGQVDGQQVVRAAVKLPDDAVLAVRKLIDEIPTAASAVASAFEVAALAGLLLTGILAFPLAGTLVRRLQHLREAAQRVAAEGAGAEVPTDRARDEVGDLARSFAIMQRRLAHQEEARRAFVATASHELRTPLASLEGMLELVAEDVSEHPELSDAATLLDRARSQSRRLSRLAADLLDLSRIDAEVPLRSEPVELSELTRAVLAEFEQSLTEHAVHGQVSGEAGPVWVHADPGKLAQILRILIDNALRVAPADSAVTVTLTRSGLTVSDHGPGVAPEERDLIFERFKRGSATGGEAGFGLGLAIGRELARRMDGDLILLDTAAGATFALSVPSTPAPDGAEAESVSVPR